MRECLMFHRVRHIILGESNTYPGLDNWKLENTTNWNNISNGNKYFFRYSIRLLYKALHEACLMDAMNGVTQ